jgi:hypothetical protein
MDDLNDLPALGRDPGAAHACGHCGWEGPAAPVGPAGNPFTAECPRCHEPVQAGMPSVEEIEASRVAPKG